MEEFDLYLTDSGLRPVTSPIKREILHLLKNESRAQKDIALAIGRAQATTSRHLLELEAANLISSILDPEDSRRKLYSLSARLAASGREPVASFTPFIEQVVGDGLAGNLPLLEAFNRSLRFTVESWGLTFDTLLREAGHTIGRLIGATLSAGDLVGLVDQLADFWQAQKLGRIELHSTSPVVLRIEGNYECKGAPDMGRPLCAMDEGLMEAILALHLGGEWRVREFACHGTGHDHCLFKVEKPPARTRPAVG